MLVTGPVIGPARDRAFTSWRTTSRGFKASSERLVGQWGYTGQIGFDFIIDDDGELFVLECNPRATSGLHLLAGQPLADAFLQARGPLLVASGERPRMLAAIMLMYALPAALKHRTTGSLYRDMRQARDVLYAADDPLPALIAARLSLAEVMVRACRTRQRLTAASTFDIEWNGEPMENGSAAIAAAAIDCQWCLQTGGRHCRGRAICRPGRRSRPRRALARPARLAADRAADRKCHHPDGRAAGWRAVACRSRSTRTSPTTRTSARPTRAAFCIRARKSPTSSGRLLRAALRGLLRVIAGPLRRARINSAVYVNNWLLSTNLYPELPVELIPEMTRRWSSGFPIRPSACVR